MVTAERRITINDGIARVEDISLVAVGTMSSVLPVLATRVPTLLPVLPEGTSSFTYDPESMRGRILVSRKPQVVTLAINGGGEHSWSYEDEEWGATDADGYKTFRVAMPWLHWLWDFRSDRADPSEAGAHFTYEGTYLYWSHSKLTHVDDGLDPMRLPNIYEEGEICWGDVASDLGSFASRIDSRINAYFQTQFNDDLGLRMPRTYSSYAGWAEDTENDEYCFLNWTQGNSTTVREVMSLQDVHTPTAREGWAPPPERFTVAGARDWARTAPEHARRRLLAGMIAALGEVDETPDMSPGPYPEPEPTELPNTAPRFAARTPTEGTWIGRHVVWDIEADTLVSSFHSIARAQLVADRLNERVAQGAPIAQNGTGRPCLCAVGYRIHNMAREYYHPPYLTTEDHRYHTDIPDDELLAEEPYR